MVRRREATMSTTRLLVERTESDLDDVARLEAGEARLNEPAPTEERERA